MKNDRMDRWLDRGFFGAVGLFIAVMLVVLLYMAGFYFGLYGVSCGLEPSQPHCVKAGWGTHNDVTLRSGAKP